MILKEKYKKILPQKYKGNSFCPWVTLIDPPVKAQMKLFQTQNVPDIIPMILKDEYKKFEQKHEGNQFCPWVTLKDIPWGGSDEFFSNSK